MSEILKNYVKQAVGQSLNKYNKDFVNPIKEQITSYTTTITSVGGDTVSDSVAGTIQDIEILGNTYQNPSNLAEIKSVGKLREDGLYEVNVKSYGKNIFNLFEVLNGEYSVGSDGGYTEFLNKNKNEITLKTTNANYWQCKMYTIQVKPNTIYKLNYKKDVLVAPTGGSSRIQSISLYNFNGENGKTITTTNTGKLQIQFLDQSTNGGGIGTTSRFTEIQLEEVPTTQSPSTPFEPYKETVATIKLPCQLEGIGDIKDRFYFDKQQGKWFIEKKIGTTILTESNSWQYMSGFDSTNHMGFFLTNMPNMEIQPVFSDKFRYNSNMNLDEELVRMTTPGGIKRLFLKIAKTKLTTQDVNGLKNWLKTNNVLVKYVFLSSVHQLIELPLDTQIILNSFDGVTHIELDGGEIQGTIKCKVSKSLKSSVNSLVEKTDSLDNRVKQIEGLKESQSLAYESPKGSLVCTDTKNGIIEDLKISGRTLVNHINAIDSGLVTQHGATAQKLIDEQCYKITFTSTEWSGCKRIPCFTLDPNKTYTLVIDVLENTCTNQVDMAHKLYDPAMFRHDYLIEPGWIGRCNLIKYTGRSSLAPATYVYQSGASGYVKARYMVLEGDYTGANSNLIPEYFEGIKNVEGRSYGRNLYTNTKKINLSEWVWGDTAYTKEGTTKDGFDIITRTGAWAGLRKPIILEPNSYYTLSAYVKGDGKSKICMFHSATEVKRSHPNETILPTEWTKVYLTVKTKRVPVINSMRFENSQATKISYYGFKLEKNDIPTEWSPAPEDEGVKETITLISKKDNLDYKNRQVKPLFYYNVDGDMKIIPELREWDTIEKHSDGKYYYHKVSGETTLTGDENWTVGLTGTPNFYYELPVTLTSKTGGDKVICNTLPCSGIGSSTTAMGISTTQHGRLRIRLNSEIPLADFKQWLKTNSTTVVFKAPQEEVYECLDLTLSSYEGMTNIQTISGAIKPSIEFKISSHINNVVLSNRDRINNIEKDFVDYVASQSAITLETRYMLDNMLPNNVDDYEENIDYNIYGLLKKNIENDNVFIKKEKLMEMLDFYLNAKKITQEMYYELSLNFIETGEIK